MRIHGLFQILHLLVLLRQRRFIAFGEFLDALRQALADAIHFGMDVPVDGGDPFVVDHQLLDCVCGECGVERQQFGIQFHFSRLNGFLGGRFLFQQFQVLPENFFFVNRLRIVLDFFQACVDAGFVDLVEYRKCAFLATVLFFHFR